MSCPRVWNIVAFAVVGCVNIRTATRAEETVQVGAKLSAGDHIHVEVVGVDQFGKLVDNVAVLAQQQGLTAALREPYFLPEVDRRHRLRAGKNDVNERRYDQHDGS